MTPHTFLLALLSTTHEADEACRAASPTMDWTAVLRAARTPLHPMLAHQVLVREIPVPAPVRETLQAARRGAAVILAARRGVIRTAFNALATVKTPFVVLKGLALSSEVYPSPEFRVMDDIDLWIGGPSLAPAMAALAPLGWRMPWWRSIHANELGRGSSVGLQHRGSPLILELHLRPQSLADAVPQALDTMWSRRVDTDLGGFQAPTLRPDDLLVHLCLHLARHHRFVGALPRLVDVTLLVERHRQTIDWPSFALHCREFGIAGWVATSLGAARRMLSAPISDPQLEAFAIDDLDALCNLAAEQAWLDPRVAVNPTSLMASGSAEQFLGGLVDRIRQLIAPGDWAEAPGAWRRLAGRLRLTLQYNLPAMLRAAGRGAFHGDAGATLRRLGARNSELVVVLRRVSASAVPASRPDG